MAQRRLKQNFNEVQAILDAVGQKVDKVEGKGLSVNDYTDQDKNKLASVEEDAQENVIEAIESDGVELPIENKTVKIPTHKQSDWSQNDSSGKDYIKNRTHWEENGVVHKLHPKFLDMDASPTSGSTKPVTSGGVKEALDGKQDVISDLADIRQGAGLGETAYQKPSSGIPASDLAAGVIPDVSGFITRTVNDLANYYLKSETYTKEEVAALIGAIRQFHYEVYATRPQTGEGNVLYLIGPTGSGSDKYEEYVYANNGWIKIGDTSIDLSGYVTIEALNQALSGYVTSAALATALTGKVGSETIHNIVELTQAEYDALQTKRDDTMYIITDTEIPSSEVGIAGFEQTTESSEDGGTNIWTVTLTNGQTFQLAVKNGKQGNSGYSGAAGELEVVNNLTDGGATAALSAEMGKGLGGRVSAMDSTDAVELYASTSGYRLSLDGFSVSQSGYLIKRYEVTAGRLLYLRIADPETGGSSFMFQDQYAISQTYNPHIVGNPWPMAYEGILEVPAGASWLAVCEVSGNTSNVVRYASLAEYEAWKADIPNIFDDTPRQVGVITATPSTSAARDLSFELDLLKGRTYKFVVDFGGYVIRSGQNHTVAMEVLRNSDPAAANRMASVTMPGKDISTSTNWEAVYTAPVDSNFIRLYIGRASTAGTGIKVTVTEISRRVRVDDTLTIAGVPADAKAAAPSAGLASYGSTPLGVTIEQGSLNTDGTKVASANRVRTALLVKTYGRFTLNVNSGYQYVPCFYTTEDFTSRVTDERSVYVSGQHSYMWEGYVGLVIKNDAGTAIVPSDVTLTFNSVSIASVVREMSPFNVKDYGAVGDGVTDDSVAITAAVAGGGRVFFPDGTYLVNTAVPLKSNTEVILSPGATILRGVNIKALFYTDYDQSTTGYDGVNNLVFRGGCLDMGTEFTQGGFPLGLLHAAHIRIEDVTFKGANAGYHCIDACGVRDLIVRGCVFKGILTNSVFGECIQIDNAKAYSHFPIKLDGDYDCWDGTVCDGIEITGCRFELNDYSPAIGNHNDGQHRHIDIHDNLIIGTGSSTNTRGAIAFGPYSSGDIVNITDFVNCHDNTIINFAIGFQIETSGLVVVKNNVLINVETLRTANSRGTFESNVTN